MNRDLFLSDFRQLARLHPPEELPTVIADYVKNMCFVPGHSKFEQLVHEDIVIGLCCNHFQMHLEDMAKPDRHMEVRRARQITMYLLASRCGIPHRNIGKLFNRDRTTVTATKHRIEEEMEINQALRLEIEQLNAQL